MKASALPTSRAQIWVFGPALVSLAETSEAPRRCRYLQSTRCRLVTERVAALGRLKLSCWTHLWRRKDVLRWQRQETSYEALVLVLKALMMLKAAMTSTSATRRRRCLCLGISKTRLRAACPKQQTWHDTVGLVLTSLMALTMNTALMPSACEARPRRCPYLLTGACPWRSATLQRLRPAPSEPHPAPMPSLSSQSSWRRH
mmetsp:Transcript_44657/g.80891  ORF Transcript_44657/g.80891 Transcript_44657/m.80891 type:complete len:201 (-) Transcript_44657:14-616(-)